MKLPIRVRLALAYCSVFFVVILALEAGTYVSVRAAVHSIVDRELETRLAGIVDHLDRHIERQPWTQLRESLAVHPAFQPAHFYMRRAGQEPMFEGRFMNGIGGVVFAGKPRVETWQASGNVLRVLTIQAAIHGQPYDLALATDLLVPSAVLNHLWLVMLISLPAVLLLASAAGYWIAGRALAPVSGIVAAAKSIDTSRLSDRVAVPDTGDEIRLLAVTINGMLARIEDGVSRIQQFTADASHEMRTPAAIIRTSAEVALLKSPRSERTYREALHRILREAERNSTLLANLLELARADARTHLPEIAAVDLPQSASRVVAQLAPLAEAKRLRIQLNKSDESIVIRANEDHLRRLWLILLENAVRYTAEGGRIFVEIGTTAAGGAYCAVRDTGIGIAPEHLPRIFERFYRADKVRSRADGGTGLGLAIARELAALYDAAIEVESEVGVGTAFRVMFPSSAVAQHGRTAHSFAATSYR